MDCSCGIACSACVGFVSSIFQGILFDTSGWQTFSYAINGDKCEQFDIGRKIENFLPENAEYLGYINTTNNNVFLDGYHIVQNDMHNIEIYKNDKLICHTVSPFEGICIMDAKGYINKVR